jgi:hypothetical protein
MRVDDRHSVDPLQFGPPVGRQRGEQRDRRTALLNQESGDQFEGRDDELVDAAGDREQADHAGDRHRQAQDRQRRSDGAAEQVSAGESEHSTVILLARREHQWSRSCSVWQPHGPSH